MYNYKGSYPVWRRNKQDKLSIDGHHPNKESYSYWRYTNEVDNPDRRYANGASEFA